MNLRQLSILAASSSMYPSLLRQHAAVILARQAAMRKVKRRRQKQGFRETLPMAVLSRLAIEHLQANPELYAEAAVSPIVQNLSNSFQKKEVEKSSTSAVQISFSDSRSRPQVKNVYECCAARHQHCRCARLFGEFTGCCRRS
jgi:hypothetical protein